LSRGIRLLTPTLPNAAEFRWRDRRKPFEICIYRLEETDWSLEVVAEDGTSTVWNEPFKSDEEALEEALRAIEEDGIDSFSAKQNEKRVLH